MSGLKIYKYGTLQKLDGHFTVHGPYYTRVSIGTSETIIHFTHLVVSYIFEP